MMYNVVSLLFVIQADCNRFVTDFVVFERFEWFVKGGGS